MAELSPPEKRAFIKRGRMSIARVILRAVSSRLCEQCSRNCPWTRCSRFLAFDAAEQLALQDILFGRIVTWRRDVRRGRVTPEQIEQMQLLLKKHLAAVGRAIQT